MVNSRTELDFASHALRGVRGYLDYQDAMNSRAIGVISEVAKPVTPDLYLLSASILEAGKWATATEIKVRENERKVRIGAVTHGAEFSGTAQVFNSHAIQSAKGGLAHARMVSRRFDQAKGPMAQIRDVHNRDEMKESLAEAREVLIGSALYSNISADEFEELLNTWDKQVNIFSKEGIGGTTREIKQHLERFIEDRNKTDRGTSPGSPWPKWKEDWTLALLGLCIGLIVTCLLVVNCTWVLALTAAILAVLLGILLFGC